MNEKLLAWLDTVRIALGHYNDEVAVVRGWSKALIEYTKNADADALAQLRAMLQSPKDEDVKEMLEDFEYILGVSGLPESDWTPKIRALISRADDVDRLVSAAKEYVSITDPVRRRSGTTEEQEQAREALKAALIPFKEKESASLAALYPQTRRDGR